jgi:hypothetical protein
MIIPTVTISAAEPALYNLGAQTPCLIPHTEPAMLSEQHDKRIHH